MKRLRLTAIAVASLVLLSGCGRLKVGDCIQKVKDEPWDETRIYEVKQLGESGFLAAYIRPDGNVSDMERSFYYGELHTTPAGANFEIVPCPADKSKPEAE